MNDQTVTSNTRRDSSPTMTRRSAIRTFAGAGVVLAAVALGGAGSWASAQAVQQYKTTTALNFRAGPGTSYPVIRVIPAGGIVAHTGKVQNSFYEVGYGGTSGWVHNAYLVPVGSSDPTPVFTGQRKVATNVNLRAGAGTTHPVLRVVPVGSIVRSSDTVKNGFRYVAYQGQAGWIADSYLALPGHIPSGPTGPVYDPSVATATANLNLRTEPSLSAKVLLVIPSGARVRMEGGGSGQFSKVSYNGTSGWAATAYLN